MGRRFLQLLSSSVLRMCVSGAVIPCIAWIAIASSSFAQTGESLCDIASARGSAMYNKYCGSPGGGAPAYDYEAAARAQAAAAAAAAHQAELRRQEAERQRIADERRRAAAAAQQAAFIHDRDTTVLKGSTGTNFFGSSGLKGDTTADADLKVVSGPKLMGSNTKGGDQLKSASVSKDLTANFDRGNAGYAGSLGRPSDFVKDQAFNSATFTEKERNAPGMREALKQLGNLKTKGSQIKADLDKTLDERNREKDPKRFAELTAKADKETSEYQGTLKAITTDEAKVTAIRKHINTDVGAAAGASGTAK